MINTRKSFPRGATHLRCSCCAV
ncbi:MAG: hypothetical protein KDK97_09440 [Verrucomicrobiales bacterium]|nr:hypothetical protein [Verrucomicrobiales bacterium]MCP5559169.1 hypothetical protein [Verrucomicrobiaceae bacterium]